MTEKSHKAGFIAVVGRPNVGKSTLINAIVGSKVSIVTPKPQTTRHRILGILNRDDGQLIFVDTPGLHGNAKNAMNRAMNRVSVTSISDADIVLVVVEALALRNEDREVLAKLENITAPVVLVVNKIDQVKDKKTLLPFIAQLSKEFGFAQVIPVSAKMGTQLEVLVDELLLMLPESVALYPAGAVTDKDRRFMISEVIREKLMWRLDQELPYGIAVEVESIENVEHRLVVGVVIWVEREGQKAIVIGKQGKMLKEVGQAARLELRESLGESIHLDLWVKVRDNWSNNEQALRQLGHDLS